MLTIRNLTHTYSNGVTALQNVNLDIPKGMFGLLGPNGAGKSSLMRTIATLQQSSAGRVCLDDNCNYTDPFYFRQHLGYLPQDFGVYPRGTAQGLLNHIAILKGITNSQVRKRVVETLLVKTNLFDVRKKKITTFSGGMRQRFGIAQALIGNPKLIVVDEPTAGLDPEERNRFHNLLSEIGENVVVILSTHIVEDISNLCSNAAILIDGKISLSGVPNTLVKNYEGMVWERVIHKQELETLKTRLNVISDHLYCGETFIRVVSKKRPDEKFALSKPTLEDVYFNTLKTARAKLCDSSSNRNKTAE